VPLLSNSEFQEINVQATQHLAQQALACGVKHIVFTSTTALYGYAAIPTGRAGWIDENVSPQPRTIYHRTKIAAENVLEQFSNEHGLPVTVLQMSRCFPERADLMAVYRLTRGIDFRDVASAHDCAIQQRLPGFNRLIVSAETPFAESDCELLLKDAPTVIRTKAPRLADAFEARDWQLPQSLDRVYCSKLAQSKLNWLPAYGFESVMEILDNQIAEVLPVKTRSQTSH